MQIRARVVGIGPAANGIRYTAHVTSPASADDIARLLRETDAVAEMHNTVRQGVPVQWVPWPLEPLGRFGVSWQLNLPA